MDNKWKNKIAYDDFRNSAIRDSKKSYKPIIFGGFEWLENADKGTPLPRKCNITELRERPPCPLRIVFAPLDIPNARDGKEYLNIDDFISLFEFYSIPGEFVSERLHNVVCSFGNLGENNGSNYSYFHFLCKNIPVEEDEEGRKKIVNKNRRVLNDLSQADFTWARSAYCLKMNPPNQTRSWTEVTLIIFSVGVGVGLYNKLNALATNVSWQVILEDPFCLLNIVFEALYAQVDTLAWNLGTVYGQEEEKIFRLADDPGSATDVFDFVGIHMLSKYQIYLLEATEAILATLNSVKEHHEQVIRKLASNSHAVCETQANLRYRIILFKSTDMRLKSLEKRTKNAINLSFNLVTQADSRIMRSESSAMKAIAVMGLVFLPFQAVVSFFSTPFFHLERHPDHTHLNVSVYIWLIWGISIPLTVLVVFAWYRFQMRRKTHIIQGTQLATKETV